LEYDFRFIFKTTKVELIFLIKRFVISSQPFQYWLWVECKVDLFCFDYFLKFKILTIPGENFGAEKGRFVRMNMISDDSTFNILIEKLKLFIKN
jgi:aspartate/methionine/tyrosine aminotransferase